MEATEVDFSARYRVKDWSAIAVWIKDFYTDVRPVDVEYEDEDGEPFYFVDYEDVVDHERVIVVMVGDDREHTVEVADLIKISDDDYCSHCGQLGCQWS